MSSSGNNKNNNIKPGGRRILIVPSAGMGHLIPSTRLATALSSHGISVSILVPTPTVSDAESSLFSSLPPSLLLPFPLAPLDPSLFPPSSDPFYLQMESIRRSAHLLPPLLSSSSPPFSSLILDISLASTYLPLSNLPSYIFTPANATMSALCSVFPSIPKPIKNPIFISKNLPNIPISSLPPPLHNPNHLFAIQFTQNGESFTLAKAFIINTYSALEGDVISAFNSGLIIPNFPPVIPIAPLLHSITQLNKTGSKMNLEVEDWLKLQPRKSVLYVNFGNRSVLSREQIRELGAGLEMSGKRFLWVVKSVKVDREEKGGIEELVGEGYLKRVKERGKVVKEWVDQERILGDEAVGGFLSHSGWSSVMEAGKAGVKMLMWPRLGDHRVNAGAAVGIGMGIWEEEWEWEGDEGIVKGEDIASKVRELFHLGEESVGRVRDMMKLELEEDQSIQFFKQM